jgi:TRAP-type C4-dicarboxylate transport system permease large subunit
MYELLVGAILLLIFVFFVYLVMKGYPLNVVILLLVLLWAVAVLMPPTDFLGAIENGATKYATLIVYLVMGVWFGRLLSETGIVETTIRYAAEWAGDRRVLATLLVCAACTFLATAMPGGAPTAISLGVIALPILFQLEIPKDIAITLFMGSLGAGWFISPAVAVPYSAFFGGTQVINFSKAFPYLFVGLIVYLAIVWLFAIIYLTKYRVRGATNISSGKETLEKRRAPWYSLFSPVLLVVLIMVFKVPVVPAFLIAIVYALLTSGRRSIKEHLDILNRSLLKGIDDGATLIGLWITVGILIVISQTPSVSNAIGAVFSLVFPTNPWLLALLLAIIGPIAMIYRGPLELIGAGAAFYTLLYQSKIFNPYLLYILALVTDKISGSMDPTSSGVLWCWTTNNVPQKAFLKRALPMGYLMNAVNMFLLTYLFTLQIWPV